MAAAALVLLSSRDAGCRLTRFPSAISTFGCVPMSIEGTLVAHIYDVAHDLRIEPMERLLDPVVVSTRSAEHHPAAVPRPRSGRGRTRADGGLVGAGGPRGSPVDAVADSASTSIARRGRWPSVASLFPYDPRHQTFVNIYEGDALTQAILDRGKARFEYFAGTPPGRPGRRPRSCPPGFTTS